MGLRTLLVGYFAVGSDSNNSQEVPGMPLLTLYLRDKGELEVVVAEKKVHDTYKEIRYDLKVDGEDVGTYRVREEGSFWSELFLGKECKVTRNVFLTTDDLPSLDIQNFEGNHYQDLRRLLFDYEKAGMYYVVQDHHKKQESVSDNQAHSTD